MKVENAVALTARITDAVETRLTQEQNPLVVDCEARGELRQQICRIVWQVLRAVALIDGHHAEQCDAPAPIGARRARQGIHPSASLAAADALFDSALSIITDVAAQADAVAVARALNVAIGDEITRASADYVDVLIARLAVAAAAPSSETESPSRLTPRELQVLRLIAEARSNAQIAQELSIAEGTVKRHAGAIYDKLGARSRLDAVRKAVQQRIL